MNNSLNPSTLLFLHYMEHKSLLSRVEAQCTPWTFEQYCSLAYPVDKSYVDVMAMISDKAPF